MAKFSKISMVEFGSLAVNLEPKSRFLKDPTDAKDHNLKVHAVAVSGFLSGGDRNRVQIAYRVQTH